MTPFVASFLGFALGLVALVSFFALVADLKALQASVAEVRAKMRDEGEEQERRFAEVEDEVLALAKACDGYVNRQEVLALAKACDGYVNRQGEPRRSHGFKLICSLDEGGRYRTRLVDAATGEPVRGLLAVKFEQEYPSPRPTVSFTLRGCEAELELPPEGSAPPSDV